MDSDFIEKGGQTDDQVRVAINRRPFAEEVFVAVHHGVDQPAALGVKWLREPLAADAFEFAKEAVSLAQADRQAQPDPRDIELLLQPACRRLGLRSQRSAKLEGGSRARHLGDGFQRGAARLNTLVFAPGLAVEGI